MKEIVSFVYLLGRCSVFLFWEQIVTAVTNIVAADIQIYFISRMPNNGPEKNDNNGV